MSVTYEKIVKETGWGMYYKFLVCFGCCSYMAQAIVYLTIPFALPLVSCSLKSEVSSVLWMNVILTIAMLHGYLMFGFFADIYGRKGLIIVTSNMTFWGCFAMSFIAFQGTAEIFLLFFGLGLAGLSIVLPIHIAECMPVKKRGKVLVLLHLCWWIAFVIFTAVISGLFAMIDLSPNNDFRVFSWRIIFSISSIFIIFTSCIGSMIMKSPRYLLMKEYYLETVDVLRKMYSLNTSQHVENFPRVNLRKQLKTQNFGREIPALNSWDRSKRFFRRIWILLKTILQSNNIQVFYIAIILKIVFIPEPYMINFWLSKTILHYQYISNDCVIDSNNISFFHDVTTNGSYCSGEINDNLFLLHFGLNINAIVGHLILYCTIDTIGRKFCLFISCFLTFLAGVVIKYFSIFWLQILISSIFLLGYTSANTVLNIIMIESFPTAVRASANGIIRIPAYLFSIFFKIYFESQCSYTYWIYGLVIGGSSLLVLILPIKGSYYPLVE